MICPHRLHQCDLQLKRYEERYRVNSTLLQRNIGRHLKSLREDLSTVCRYLYSDYTHSAGTEIWETIPSSLRRIKLLHREAIKGAV